MLSDLKKARLEANLTIDDVSNQLNIRRKYLIALEENDLGAIPGDVYINGYLKIYAKFLNIDIPDIKSNPTKTEKQLSSINSEKLSPFLIIVSLLILIGVIIMYPLVI